MTSTLSRMNSAAISAKRSSRPSAQRYSIAMVRFSIQPSSRSLCTKASVEALSNDALFAHRTPIVGSLPACCARAASGHAAAAPPSSVMKSRRLTPSIGLPPLGWATDTYRMLNLAQRGRQVLGADLNCSESRWALSTGLHCHPKR